MPLWPSLMELALISCILRTLSFSLEWTHRILSLTYCTPYLSITGIFVHIGTLSRYHARRDRSCTLSKQSPGSRPSLTSLHCPHRSTCPLTDHPTVCVTTHFSRPRTKHYHQPHLYLPHPPIHPSIHPSKRRLIPALMQPLQKPPSQHSTAQRLTPPLPLHSNTHHRTANAFSAFGAHGAIP